jgi:uncharacterized protein (TIGR01777 family)
VLVTGATGFIGRRLVVRLVERGDHVLAFVRNEKKAAALFGTRVTIVTDLEQLPARARVDAIVNLAGEPIAARPWTARRRALLLASRLDVTRSVLALVTRLETKPATWINGSAIGYYGARADDEPLHEKAGPGTGFQAELCRRWEQLAAGAEEHGVRVSAFRIGVVLGRGGGALPALARPVRWFVGAALGSGQQWFSWIHLDDLVDLMLFVLDEATLAGPINATAPAPVRHAELMAVIAATVRRPLWPLKVPAQLLKVGLGELAELFVAGQRVLPARAQALGFEFRYPTIATALADALGDPRRPTSTRRENVSGAQ